jgi:hypothetical protein
MNIFLKLEVRSNLLGKSENDVLIVPVEQVLAIKSGSEGNTLIYLKEESAEASVCSQRMVNVDMPIESFLNTCVISLDSYVGSI